jgi:hypothetical protein
MTQKPSVCRLVNYVSHGTPVRPDGTQAFASKPRAAVITEVDDDDPNLVGLCVINPTGLFFHPIADGGSRYDETGQAGGSWHWPPRV